MAKRTHSNRKVTKYKAGAELYQPQSPAGKMKSKSGKSRNLGIADPMMPLWTEDPRIGTVKFLPRIAS